MKKKALSLLLISMMTVISAISVAAKSSEETGSISGYGVTFRNEISASLLNGNASTSVGYPTMQAYVDADFYWIDVVTGERGICQKAAGHDGGVTVLADSLANTDKIYYKVISYHSAQFGGMSLTCPELTTTIP